MARPKETDEQKVKKVYKDARLAHLGVNVGVDGANSLDIDTENIYVVYGEFGHLLSGSHYKYSDDAAWSDALTQIRKAKIKAAKDKRKQAKPVKVKEIKKHVGLTMYPSDKAIIISGFGSVQKFLDIAIREYKDRK
jgi:hypothetical protein